MCRATYAVHNTKTPWDKETPVQKDPPCGKCRPELHPDNSLVLALYQRCSDQWQSSLSGGGHHIANSDIKAAMEIMDVPEHERLLLLDDLKVLASEIAEIIEAEQEKARENAKLNSKG